MTVGKKIYPNFTCSGSYVPVHTTCSPFACSWLLRAFHTASQGSWPWVHWAAPPNPYCHYQYNYDQDWTTAPLQKSTANPVTSHSWCFFFVFLYNLCTWTNCALVARSLAAYILPTGALRIRVAAESVLLHKHRLRCAAAASPVMRWVDCAVHCST